jgi:hypothetical protein
MMRRTILAVLSLALLIHTPFAQAQRGQVRRDPMTDKEIDEMRELRDQPDKRIKLMVSIIQKRADALNQLEKSPKVKPSERGAQIHDLLEDITNLVDEFQENIDTFLKESADFRKPLNESVTMQTALQAQLHGMQTADADKPWFSEYQFQLTDAIEAVDQSLKSTKDAVVEDERVVKEQKEKAAQRARPR